MTSAGAPWSRAGCAGSSASRGSGPRRRPWASTRRSWRKAACAPGGCRAAPAVGEAAGGSGYSAASPGPDVTMFQAVELRSSMGPSMSTGRVLVFIPAWNEEATVAGVVRALRERIEDADVLVVDDGSTDRTAERAREAGASILALPFHRGLGAALQTGYRYASRNGYRI